MASSKRRGLERGRKKQNREKRKRHLIVSNGKVTEGEYFNTVIEDLNVRGSVRYQFIDGDPLSVVRCLSRKLELDKKAERLKEIEPISSVWVVVDVDQFRNLGEAERAAKEAGYNLAVSNPCFEVWLIDHDSPCPETCTTAAQCERRAISLGLLKSTDANRDSSKKFKSIVSEKLQGKYDVATANAAKHNSDDKRIARMQNVDKVASYEVWTDVPELMTEVFGAHNGAGE